MASAEPHSDSVPNALPMFDHPTLPSPKHGQSVPDSHRRHSLPLHFLPPGLWSANTSSASLVESEEAARGEHILDEATVAHRISALRQLNGATRSRHRYAKSTGARSSTFNQPVIVRTYSGTARPRSQQRDVITVKKEKGLSAMANGKMELKLPPVEAFSFKGIMDEIRHGVAEDLERIAEICARSKYSLSNQYEVHMPPHGRGEPILQRVGLGVSSHAHGAGPTLQAIGSDDEQTRQMGRGSRVGRRTKSVAYGTLETIMSSSRSSDEDKSKKKPAAVLAEEVRGRAARKELQASMIENSGTGAVEDGPAEQMPPKHVRSRSTTLASMIIDSAQGFKNDGSSNAIPSTSLISEPARPQTSTAMDLETMPVFDEIERERSPTLYSFMSPRLGLLRHESMSSTLRPEPEPRPSILGSLGAKVGVIDLEGDDPDIMEKFIDFLYTHQYDDGQPGYEAENQALHTILLCT
ncbi:hypothetical protein N431DRAFT_474068 [Stipitochalara longipes BDJ]|nr:hypothetical protein N431DRAFT_474068 [Stipitochalara longipes BDJ]